MLPHGRHLTGRENRPADGLAQVSAHPPAVLEVPARLTHEKEHRNGLHGGDWGGMDVVRTVTVPPGPSEARGTRPRARAPNDWKTLRAHATRDGKRTPRAAPPREGAAATAKSFTFSERKLTQLHRHGQNSLEPPAPLDEHTFLLET